MFDKVKYDVVLDDGVQPYRYLMVVDRYGVFFFKVEILVIVLCDLLIQRHDHTHFMTFFHQSGGREPMTSARPPVLMNGSPSPATIRMLAIRYGLPS